MTPLRQRMIGDMRIRNLAATTQRSYVHYVAEFAKYFQRSPEHLDLEAFASINSTWLKNANSRRKASTVSCPPCSFCSSPRWKCRGARKDFPRARLDHKLPVVLAPEEVQTFFENVTGVKNRAILFTCWLALRTPHLRGRCAQGLRRR